MTSSAAIREAPAVSEPPSLPTRTLVEVTGAFAAGRLDDAFRTLIDALGRYGVRGGAVYARDEGTLTRIAGEPVSAGAFVIPLEHEGASGELHLEAREPLDDDLQALVHNMLALVLSRRQRIWEFDLVQAAMDVNAAQTLDDALQVLAETCCRVLEVPSTNIAVWEPDFSFGTVRAAAGATGGMIGEQLREGSLAAQATRAGRPVTAIGSREAEGVSDSVRKLAAEFACTVAVPVDVDGVPRMTFHVDWPQMPTESTIARAVTAIRKLDALTTIAYRAEQERERKAHHDLLSAVIETVPEGIWIRHGSETTVNAAMRRILRLGDETVVDPDMDVKPRRLDGTPIGGDDWPSAAAVRTGKIARERLLSTIGGEDRVLDYIAAPMPGGFVGVIRDVTEEYGEQVLNQHFLESLFASLPVGVGIADLRTHEMKSVNPALAKIVGYDVADMVGARTPFPWWSREHEMEYWDTPAGSIERVFRRADGTPVPVEITPFHVHGADGSPAWLVALVREVGERQRLERQIIQSGKLAAIGELASGVAHEINNPLFAILGLVEFLLRDADPGTKVHERLTLIQQTGLEIKEIVKALLDFSRERTDEFMPMLVREVVSGAVDLVRRTSATKSIEIVEEYPDEELPVLGSPNQIKQILLNLISNAQQAMGDSGTITISVARVECCVEIVVSDTGPGIPADVLPRIFEPFFTTKRDVGGTGLGLAVSHGIAEMHGGDLCADSTAGVGATFRLRLPLAAGEAE